MNIDVDTYPSVFSVLQLLQSLFGGGKFWKAILFLLACISKNELEQLALLYWIEAAIQKAEEIISVMAGTIEEPSNIYSRFSAMDRHAVEVWYPRQFFLSLNTGSGFAPEHLLSAGHQKL
jgi:hypothetical protein